MHSINNTELSSLEETRCQFNGGRCAIKLGIDVHQEFYVVVMQEGGANPKPPQRFQKEAFLQWAGRLKQKSGAEVYAVYEACGFGFSLQRNLSGLSIHCYVICPQKLDEQNRRVKTDGLDAKALCLKLDRFVQGNRAALAIVRVPSEAEERSRAIHRQREQLVGARKRLEAQGRSLMVNHGFEPVQNWWKPRPFAALEVPQLDERAAFQLAAHPRSVATKDRRPERATAMRGCSRATARPGQNDQRRARPGDRRLEPL